MLKHTLNGTEFTFDEETGAIISMYNSGCGEIIKNGKGRLRNTANSQLRKPMKMEMKLKSQRPPRRVHTFCAVLSMLCLPLSF